MIVNVSIHGIVVVHVPCLYHMLRYVRDPAPRGSPPPDRTPRGGPPRDGTMDQFGNCHGRDRPDGRVVSMVVSTLSSAHAHRRVRVVPFLTCCRPPTGADVKKVPHCFRAHYTWLRPKRAAPTPLRCARTRAGTNTHKDCTTPR